VGKEGFNVTVAGTYSNILQYIKDCLSHWSFSGLECSLDTQEKRNAFFKPTPGCACVFPGPASVRITEEITPMGVTNYSPENWSSVESLSPEEFHARLSEMGSNGEGGDRKDKVLVDVRNHYESRIGYFVDPVSGTPALRPEIRRFAQWPLYVKTHLGEFQPSSKPLPSTTSGGEVEFYEKEEGEERQREILTYCTGGIRCEKGVRYLSDQLSSNAKISTLKGGIAAYLMWMDQEIASGRKKPEESLFKGQNYVFDARGSVGLAGDEEEDGRTVSECHICKVGCARLSKCRSKGCHLILVICAACEEKDPRCCQDCFELDLASSTSEKERVGPRAVCACEKAREKGLWGEKRYNFLVKLHNPIQH